MLKKSLLSNMTIRTSIVLVLVFYLLMLIAGAALGVLSLRASTGSLDSIVQNQRAGAALAQAVDGYRNVQSTLARAASARVFGTASEVDALLAEGRKHFEAAHEAFAAFQRNAEHTEVGRELASRVAGYFNALMNNGVEPMFGALAASNDSEYERLRDSVVPELEGELFNSWEALRHAQQLTIDSAYQGEVSQYELVLKLVAFGMEI